MATYYVATTGSDSNPGTLAAPKRTILAEIALLSASDTLYIRTGVYAEALELFGWPGGPQGTSWATAITISAYPGESVTIRPPGNGYPLHLRGSNSGATDAPRYLIFDRLIFDGINATGGNIHGVFVTSWDNTVNPADSPSHHIRFTNCRVTNVQHGQGLIAGWGSDDVQVLNTEIDNINGPTLVPNNTQGIYGAGHNMVIDGCHIHDCWGIGISNANSNPGLNVNNHTIRNNRVHDCGQGGTSLGGINLAEGTGHLIYNNLTYNNAGPGIILAYNDGSTGLGIYHNTVYGNSGIGIYISANETGAIVRNNISYGNAGGNYTNAGTGTVASNNSTDGTDPEFVNSAAGNLRLVATSPMIGAGVAIASITTDFDGLGRGSPPDIGAHEFDGTPGATPPASSSYWRLRFSDDFAYANQAAFEAAYAPGLFDDVTGARDVLYSATNGPGGIPGILADDTGTLELNDLSRAVTGSLQKPIFILEGVEYRITGVFDNSLDFIRLKAYWIDEPSVGNDDLSTYFVGVFSGKAIVGAAYGDLTVQVRTGASHITTHVVGVIPTSGSYEIDVQFKLSDTGAGYVKVYINGTLHYNYTGSVYDTGYPLLLNYVEVSPGGRFGTYRIYDRAAQTSSPSPGTLIDNSVAEGCCAVPGGSHAGPVPIPVVPASWYRTCTGGGQASSADDVVESENWAAGGVPLHPDSWLTILGPPSDPDLSDVKWGLKPLSDRDRFVEGRLSDVGEIERGSSDKDGHYTPARLRVVQQDDDAVLREKLADPSEHVFLHREARLEILSYEGRKASGSPATAPRPLLQGRVVSTQPELERRGVIEIQDIVGSQYSPLDPEKMIGLLVGSEHPNLPETSKGKIYNIFFGERSDAGAIDATGASASKGVLPVVDCGDTFLNDELPSAFDTSLAEITDKAGVNVVGAGDITFPTRVLVSVVINGVIGPPSNVPTGFLNDQGNGLGGPSDAHAHREVWMDAPGGAGEYIAWFFTNPAFHPITNPTGDPNVRFKTVSGTPTYPAFPPRAGFPTVWDFYVDFSGLTDGEPWGIQTTSSPQDLQATVNGTPGTTRYVYAVSAITTYGETRPSAPVVVTNGPAVLTATDFISLSWTAPQDNPEAVITYRILGRRDDPPTKYLAFLDSGSPIGSGLAGSPSVDLEYDDTGADPETPFNLSNQNALASENVWGWLACGQGWGDIHEVYGSDLADGAEPKRVLLDINDGDLLTPSSDEWPHASSYRIVGDIQQYGFYARGTRLQHHRDGIVTFAWNGCGFTDTDAPPLLINQAAPMLVSFLNEFVEKQNGTGYRSGAFGPIEAFADGTPKFWTSKFDVYQQATIDRMGNDLGWIGSLLVTEPTSLREILRQFFTDFAGHLTTNHRGQVYPFLVAPVDVSPVEGDIIRERMEISRLLAHRYAYDELENRVTVSYLHDADANEYRVTNQVFQDATSIAAHGGGALGTHDGGVKDCRYSNDADTVADRWAYHMELYGYPPRYVDVLLGLAALERPNGARVRFTHRKEGIGANGEALTPGVVVATKTHVQPYQVTQTIRLIAAQTFGLLQDEDTMAGNLGDEDALLPPPDGAFRLGPG